MIHGVFDNIGDRLKCIQISTRQTWDIGHAMFDNYIFSVFNHDIWAAVEIMIAFWKILFFPQDKVQMVVLVLFFVCLFVFISLTSNTVLHMKLMASLGDRSPGIGVESSRWLQNLHWAYVLNQVVHSKDHDFCHWDAARFIWAYW